MKKQSLKSLQVKIWAECKRIIKIRYGNNCYTCDAKNLKGSNRHTGHMIPKKYLPYTMKYDLRLLRPQCYNCNMNLGGMGAIFLYESACKDTIDIDSIIKQIKKDKKNPPKQKDVELFYTELLERLLIIKG